MRTKVKCNVGCKDANWSGLMKIPDDIVIRELRIEIGKQQAYIEELEYALQEDPDEIFNELLQIVKGDNLRESYLTIIKGLQKKNSKLKHQNNQLKKQLNEKH